MARRTLGAAILATVVVYLLSSLELGAQEPSPEPPRRRVIVTLDGEGEVPAAFGREDFEIRGKEKYGLSRIYSRLELPSILVIALQDGLTREFDEHVPDFAAFIRGLPKNMYVSVVRLSEAGLAKQMNLTPDPEEAVGLLYSTLEVDSEVPAGGVPTEAGETTAEDSQDDAGDPAGMQGKAGRGASPFVALAALCEKLGDLPPARVQVLFVGDGSDLTHERRNPRLELAVKNSQAAGVPIWAVHHPAHLIGSTTITVERVQIVSPTLTGLVMAEQNLRSALSTNLSTGPEFLDRLTREVGGKYLSRSSEKVREGLAGFRHLLDRQWVLEYRSDEPARKVKLRIKIPDTELLAVGR